MRRSCTRFQLNPIVGAASEIWRENSFCHAAEAASLSLSCCWTTSEASFECFQPRRHYIIAVVSLNLDTVNLRVEAFNGWQGVGGWLKDTRRFYASLLTLWKALSWLQRLILNTDSSGKPQCNGEARHIAHLIKRCSAIITPMLPRWWSCDEVNILSSSWRCRGELIVCLFTSSIRASPN